MSTNTPELTDDDRALYETFEKARAGSTRPAGTLRGIHAVLDKLRQGGEPVAWLHEDGLDVWTAHKKRSVAEHNGIAGARLADCYNVPLVRYAAPLASAPAPKPWPVEEQPDGTATPVDPVDMASAPVAGEAQKPVGRVRHFNYSGIARTGFSQEAVLNDDAPSLPDGAPLYAALQATPAPQPAEGEVVLPSLPPPFSVWHEDDDDAGAWGRPSCNVHTAEQMQEYARVAVLADRQQRAALASKEKNDG